MGSPEPPAFEAAAARLLHAERSIDLLRRCLPVNAREQTELWLAAHARGEHPRLELRYAAPPRLSPLRTELEAIHRWAEGTALPGPLYGERAAELALDAELAGLVGTPSFAPVARRRHSLKSGREWQGAAELAREYAALPEDPTYCRQPSDRGSSELWARSDDASCPHSLLRLMQQEVGQLRLAVRIISVPVLGSRAACGDGVIYIRSGEILARSTALRIVKHEVHGHAWPRLCARQQRLALFRAGSAGATEDEEGRALLIEERCELLDAARRRELGRRHLAAAAVARGAGAHECVRLLGDLGCAPREALAIYIRVARGGGLCRELEYLPALSRVGSALARDATLEAWLARGRLSLEAAKTLRRAGVQLEPT